MQVPVAKRTYTERAEAALTDPIKDSTLEATRDLHEEGV